MKKLIIAYVIVGIGCVAKPKMEIEARHYALLESADKKQKLYIDPLPPEQIMRKVDTANTNTFFMAYKITIITGPQALKKADLSKNQYYEYEMYKDWTAMSGLDSLHPVYFYPIVKTVSDQVESVLVFELPKGSQINSLRFNDPDGVWMNKQVNLN